MYSQSIPVASIADWLCYELQELFREYADIARLAIAIFSLLDNHRSIDNKVTNPTQVRSNLLRYSLVYYLFRVDIKIWTGEQQSRSARIAPNVIILYIIGHFSMVYSFLNIKA
jgi:hypothetical protein